MTEKKDNFPASPSIFRLNMQILADHFVQRYENVLFYSGGDTPCLEGVRLCHRGAALEKRFVYLADAEEADLESLTAGGGHWIIRGSADRIEFPANCTAIVIPSAIPCLAEILEQVQEIFDLYREWDRQLHIALRNEHPLTAMLKASVPVFHNPLFIHDVHFYVLAWSHRAPGMLQWDTDPRTGRNIIPLSLIHEFKVDVEYLGTLNTRVPSLYSAQQRGYPILYMNLWEGDHYQGRVCVDELETPILPGQYLAISYLADMINDSLRTSSLIQFSTRSDLTSFFRDYLDGISLEPSRTVNCLDYLRWKRDDCYLCLRLESMRQDIQMFSAVATLSHIETQIPEGHTMIYKNGISIVVNLSSSDARSSDIVSSLSPLLREGLMEMGVSSEIADFGQIPQAHLQACMALELGRNSESMVWCHRFNDYILEYLLRKAGESLPPELLCSDKLLILKDYDREHRTDLYNTLRVYLELERNVLQTAKALFIHRSTLFYRLERIEKIAGVNFDDARERLILRLSYFILGQER